MSLNADLASLKGVGPKKKALLKNLGLEKIIDLLSFQPLRYIDRSKTTKINDITPEEEVTIKAKIVDLRVLTKKKGFKILKMQLQDSTGTAFAVWFNFSFTIIKRFEIDEEVFISGKALSSLFKGVTTIEFAHPIIEKSSRQRLTGRIIPHYSLTKGLTQRDILGWVEQALQKEEITEILPLSVIKEYQLLPRMKAFHYLHFPPQLHDSKIAQKTLAFTELFLLHKRNILKKKKQDLKAGFAHNSSDILLQDFVKKLSFKLTTAQLKVFAEIKNDLESSKIMARLLQGDVGSGKTVVALMAIIKVIAGKAQSALMAPTQILAQQHFLLTKKLFEGLPITTALLINDMPATEQQQVRRKLLAGEIDLLIGTHSLLGTEVNFQRLGLVVIDEQHRFGVSQRTKLLTKGQDPDLLILTATPIPRTLTMTIYGDLDLSIIDQLPPHRKKIITRRRTHHRLKKIYQFINQKLQDKQQVYVVCPVIEKTENRDSWGAKEFFRILKEDAFPNRNLALLHGKIPFKQREQIMEDFKNKKYDILVTTTVIEVGVDVKDATIIVIEGAHYFGLAQLHQLRGRVGRSSQQSYCILLSNNSSPEVEQRLSLLEKIDNGFELAQADLALRGPGDIFGLKQHGFKLFNFFNPAEDFQLLSTTSTACLKYLESDNS